MSATSGTSPRATGRIVLAVLFALFGLNALVQVAMVLVGRSDDPAMLSALQTLVGVAGLAAALGSWRGDRWAPFAAVAYGVITGTMVASLGPLLQLEVEARPGLYVGGASVLGFGFVAAWYLRRSRPRRPP